MCGKWRLNCPATECVDAVATVVWLFIYLFIYLFFYFFIFGYLLYDINLSPFYCLVMLILFSNKLFQK